MSRDYIPKALRERVAIQAGHRCGYCLTSSLLVGAPFEIDHILPESLGGLTEEDNLWLACPLCNGHKSNRIASLDPLTGEEVRLFDPRRQVWSDLLSKPALPGSAGVLAGMSGGIVGTPTIVTPYKQGRAFGPPSSNAGETPALPGKARTLPDVSPST